MFLANKLNKGAGVPTPKDAQFNYVTMLLHGDGTNGAQNNTFLDSSTNNFTITRNGNTTQGSFSPYGSNWSNFFGGSPSYLSLSATPAQFGTNDFTVECWINPSSVASVGSVISLNPFASNGWAFGVGFPSSGDLYWYANGATVLSYSGISVGVWTHIAVSRSGSTIRMFVNGALVTSATDSINYNSNTGTYIGADLSAQYFNGYASNIRLVKGTALYTSAFTPSTTPLTAVTNTSLLTCQSNRFIDNSTNAYAITVNGTPSVQRFNPFGTSTAYSTSVIGGSGYFDGTSDWLNTPGSTDWNLGSNNFTIESWVYPTASPAQPMIIGQWTSSYAWTMQLSNDGNRYLRALLYNGSFNDYVSSTSLQLNAWNHCAFVRESNTVSLYLNGARVYTTTFTGSVSNSTAAVSVGGDNSGGQPLQGYITNSRVVNGTALYSGTTYTVPTAPLSAVTNTKLLLNMTNAAIFDNAMMNDLETVGNAQISTSVKKYGTGSLAFDGSGDGLYRPPTPNLDFCTGNFTIEWWMYFSSKSGFQTIMSYGYTPETSTGWLIQTGSGDGKIVFYKQSGGITVASDTGSTVNTGEWYHMAVVRNSGTTTIYRNGTSVGSGSDTNNYVATTAKFYLGGGSSTAFDNYFFNGYIDDLRITKGYARYTANFSVPTAAFPNTGPV
jgi:hypothetical protein